MSRVLVIDEHPDVRAFFKRLLDEEHHLFRGADNGQSGLQALDEFNPDMIFLDRRLPVMDGTEFARTLRTNPDYLRYSRIPLIGTGEFKRGEADLDAYMPEPYKKDVFYKLVRRFSRRKAK